MMQCTKMGGVYKTARLRNISENSRGHTGATAMKFVHLSNMIYVCARCPCTSKTKGGAPMSSDLYSCNLKGIRLVEEGKYGKAIEAFSEALASAPDSPALLFNRGEARRLSGDTTGAEADLQRALELVPTSPDTMHALGLLAYEDDNFDLAVDWYDKTLTVDPNFAPAWNDKGVVLFRRGAYREAYACFGAAVRLDPEFGDAWFNLADACDELNLPAEREKALATLRRLHYDLS